MEKKTEIIHRLQNNRQDNISTKFFGKVH